MHLSEYSHRRYNPLLDEWILCSPHRTKRPWQGQVEKPAASSLPAHDPGCYLCPGNVRANGERNPAYGRTFSFVNDFSALEESNPEEAMDEGGLLVARTERGLCKVICFSPRHDLTLARMDAADVAEVVRVWKAESAALGARYRSVQVFENRGAMMGCSNPHPHCQVWAQETIPQLPAREGAAQAAWHSSRGSCLLCDYLALELKKGERVVLENEGFVVLVPFWAVWPFETLVLPRRHIGSFADLSAAEEAQLADILRRTATRYDNLFQTDFPYSMGFHQRPYDGGPHGEWHFHAHFLPPLLRSATVRKFMVGYELLATSQRDITAESAAERLRALPEAHYREGL